MALLPPMLQQLFGYPVVDTGMMMAPRGVGVLVTMWLGAQVMARIDARILIITGLIIFAASLRMMAGYSLEMDYWPVVVSGFVQGLGMGLVFMPLNALAFATLDGRYRTDGASILNLTRSIGQSAGISMVTVLLARNIQTSHADLAAHITDATLPACKKDPPVVRLPNDPAQQRAAQSFVHCVESSNSQCVSPAEQLSGWDAFYLLSWLGGGSPVAILEALLDEHPLGLDQPADVAAAVVAEEVDAVHRLLHAPVDEAPGDGAVVVVAVDGIGEDRDRTALVDRRQARAEKQAKEQRKRRQSLVEEVLIQVRDGDHEEARKLLAELRAAHGTDERLDVLEAEIWIAEGRLTRATELLHQALRRRPRGWRYRYLLAETFDRLGLRAQASREIEAARRLQPLALAIRRLDLRLAEQAGDPAQIGRKRDQLAILEAYALDEQRDLVVPLAGDARLRVLFDLIQMHPLAMAPQEEGIPLD